MVKSKFYNLDTDTNLGGENSSDLYVASEKAVKAYVDNNIPTVNDAILTITQGGTSKGTFTANASSNVTIALDAVKTYSAGDGINITNDTISVDSTVVTEVELATVATTGKSSDLNNDAGFITSSALSPYSLITDTVSAVVAGTTADKINVTKNGSTSTITVNNVANATKATQDASGNVITTTYATKSELPTTTIRVWN